MNPTPPPTPQPDTLLRLPEVQRRTGRSRARLYGDVAAGTFPKPRSIGARAVGWLESEINAWIAARPVSHNLGTFRPRPKMQKRPSPTETPTDSPAPARGGRRRREAAAS